MFRKDDGARGEWSEQNVRLCAARQDEILEAAWRALRDGGTLIYSTCTFNREEDEGTLERLLEQIGEEVTEAPEVAVEASPFESGSRVVVLGKTTGAVEFEVGSVFVDEKPADVAPQGVLCSIEIPEGLHRGDKIYKYVVEKA
jgi:16S rRNA C967 or C1407 C5-methylase (RsmB/RsmF family)